MTESKNPREELIQNLRDGLTSGLSVEDLTQQVLEVPDSEAAPALAAVATEFGDKALPLLSVVASKGSGKAGVAAAEAMGRVHSYESARLLGELDSSSAAKEVKKAARRSLHRLRSAGINVESTTVAEPRPEKRRISRAMVTSIDGAGNRLIWLIGERPFGAVQMISILANDYYGIIDASGAEASQSDFEQELAKKLAVKTFAIVDAPIDYALQLVEEARAHNRLTNTPLPQEYHAWRSLIPAPEHRLERPLIYEYISATEIRWDPRLLEESPQLLAEPETITWYFDWEKIAPFVEELRTINESRIVLPTQTKEERAADAVARAITTVVDETRRPVWKRRLEEMAYVFWKLDRIRAARLSLAAALGLETDDPRAITSHPFLNALLEKSIQVHLRGGGAGLMPTAPVAPPEAPGGSGLIIP